MTAEHYEGHLGKGLVYEDSIPLTVTSIDPQTLSYTPSESARNLGVLRNLWFMQEKLHDIPEEFSELEPALVRMETKIDLLVELIGQMLRQGAQLPEACPVRISSQYLQFTAAGTAEFALGARLEMKCYLLPHLPLPLTLRGTLASRDSMDGGAQLTVSLEPLDEQGAELLDKIIFRNHRRVIARQKHQS